MDRDPRSMWNDTEPDDDAAAELFRPQGTGRPAACLAPELVQAARSGTLPEPLQERVAAHVARCSMCQALGEALDDPSVGSLTPEEHERILTQVRTGIASSTRPWIRNRRWQLYAAAGVALAALGSLLIWQFSTTRSPAPPHVALNIRQPGAPPVFRLEKPAIGGRGAPDLLRESSKPGEAADLARALEPYRTDDFAEVARRLRAVITRHPGSAAGHFYLGVSEMFLDRNAEAVTALQAAERLAASDANLRREIAWYLALAYHRTGQAVRASDNLAVLCRGQGPQAVRACVALRELAGPLTLSGVVTGRGGGPLAGAVVTEYVGHFAADFITGMPTGLSGTTDGTGRYRMSGFLASRTKQVGLRAYRPGYFSTAKSLPISRDAEIDFVLDPWVYISLGEVVRRTVQQGNPTCGDPTELCHQFALTVSKGGTLEVTLASGSPRKTWDLWVEKPTGEVLGPPLSTMNESLPLRLAIPVEGGSTYQITVLKYSDGPQEYELTTRLR